MSASDVVIVSARRTPIGAFLGALSPLSAVQLGSAAIKAAIESAGIGAGDVQEVIMGCVLPAGLGQAPARQAALGAGVPIAAPATTLNKMCGSGLKAVMMAADQIRAGTAQIILAGGLESMSNAPYLLPKARSGYRMGHGEVIDHMLRDGLQSPFDGKSMGCFADATAGTCDVSKIPAMKPAFNKDGTVTAASSSSIADGAAALVLMDAGTAASRGLKPLARILAYASHAQEPEWFTTAPVGAIRKVLTQLTWKPHDADLYEINEAFAVVTMAAMGDIDIDHARVNVNGGA